MDHVKMILKRMLESSPAVNRKYVAYKWRERRVSYGEENQDKIFYVIRRAPSKIGLFSYVSTSLGHIKYAVDQGYIPVIDMQNSENTYLESIQVGKCNAWEFYFEQPCGYTLKDISRSKNVILGNGLLPKEYPGSSIIQDEKKYSMWKEYSRKYLRVVKEVQKKIEEAYEVLLKGNRTVGVLCRGTDYANIRPSLHPIQPDVDDVIQKTREVLQEQNCDRIFLATEDETIYQQFYRAFGSRIRTTAAERYMDTGKENINEVENDRNSNKYLKGLNYLISIGVLAKCDCLVAGCTGGTYGTLLLTEGYESQYVFWLGCYE